MAGRIPGRVGDVGPGEGPDRKRYVITELGATEVQAWLSEPVEPEPHLQTVLFAKVVLALMLDRPPRSTSTPSTPPT